MHPTETREREPLSLSATPRQLLHAADAARLVRLDALSLAPPPTPPSFPQRAAEEAQRSATDNGQSGDQLASHLAALRSSTRGGSSSSSGSFGLHESAPCGSTATMFPLSMDAASAQAHHTHLSAVLTSAPEPHSVALGESMRRVRQADAERQHYSAAPALFTSPLPAAQPALSSSGVLSPTPSSTLETPLESLQELLQRHSSTPLSNLAQVHAAPLSSTPSPAAAAASPYTAEASVLALADALSSSFRNSAKATHDIAAEQQLARSQRLQQAQLQRSARAADSERARGAALEQALHDLQTEHSTSLASKDRGHSLAQAELLAAFQHDRAEEERRHAEELQALRSQLAQRESDLAAHQQLYRTYSARIQAELTALREEVMRAEQALQEKEQREREQQEAIERFQAERLAKQVQIQQQQDAEDRERWELELVQRSNEVLQRKQDSFDAATREAEDVARELAAQLAAQTDARTAAETRLAQSEVSHAETTAKLRKLEEQLASTEALLRTAELQARSQREHVGSVTAEFSSLQSQLTAAQGELIVRHGELAKAAQEYKQLESLYATLSSESGERITHLSQEAAQAHASYSAEIQGHERALREVARCRSDRLALQHGFLRLHRKIRLQRLFAHWIATTQTKKMRNIEMALLLRNRTRAMKRDALEQWKEFAARTGLVQKHAALTRQREEHVAARFSERSFRERYSKQLLFREWAGVARARARKRRAHEDQVADAQDSTAAALDAAASERSKKIELYHLLQRERAEWAQAQEALQQHVDEGMRAWQTQERSYQAQLAAERKEREELAGEMRALQSTFAQLLKQQELEREWKQFSHAEHMRTHPPVLPGIFTAAPAPVVAAPVGEWRFHAPAPVAQPTSAAPVPAAHATPTREVAVTSPSVAAVPAAPAASPSPTPAVPVPAPTEPAPVDYPALRSVASTPVHSSPPTSSRRAVTFAPETLTPAARSIDAPLPDTLAAYAASQLPQQHMLDVSSLLSDVRSHHEARVSRAELRELQSSVAAEQARLQLLSQLRHQREQEELQQSRAGPTFLAQRMPSSKLLPEYPEPRVLTDTEAAELDAGAATPAGRGRAPAAAKPRPSPRASPKLGARQWP